VIGSAALAYPLSAVAQDWSEARTTRAADPSTDAANIDIARIVGRGALRRPSDQALSRQELMTILLLMSQRRAGSAVRS
jgi:hypothetical protein